MAKKSKQPIKTCADCIHESACRVWTDGRPISDDSANRCPNHETVKESGAYLCGVLDERKRKQTYGDKIRAMSDEELAVFVRAVIMAEGCPVAGCDCDKCFFKEPCFNGSKWHGKETEWLKQPAEGE